MHTLGWAKFNGNHNKVVYNLGEGYGERNLKENTSGNCCSGDGISTTAWLFHDAALAGALIVVEIIRAGLIVLSVRLMAKPQVSMRL